jgi:hypothetical protein
MRAASAEPRPVRRWNCLWVSPSRGTGVVSIAGVAGLTGSLVTGSVGGPVISIGGGASGWITGATGRGLSPPLILSCKALIRASLAAILASTGSTCPLIGGVTSGPTGGMGGGAAGGCGIVSPSITGSSDPPCRPLL